MIDRPFGRTTRGDDPVNGCTSGPIPKHDVTRDIEDLVHGMTSRPRHESHNRRKSLILSSACYRLHGPVTARIYHPPKESGVTPPAYVNVHGGGFGVGNAERDDPGAATWPHALKPLSSIRITCAHPSSAFRLPSSRSTTCCNGLPPRSGTGTADGSASAGKAP